MRLWSSVRQLRFTSIAVYNTGLPVVTDEWPTGQPCVEQMSAELSVWRAPTVVEWRFCMMWTLSLVMCFDILLKEHECLVIFLFFIFW